MWKLDKFPPVVVKGKDASRLTCATRPANTDFPNAMGCVIRLDR